MSSTRYKPGFTISEILERHNNKSSLIMEKRQNPELELNSESKLSSRNLDPVNDWLLYTENSPMMAANFLSDRPFPASIQFHQQLMSSHNSDWYNVGPYGMLPSHPVHASILETAYPQFSCFYPHTAYQGYMIPTCVSKRKGGQIRFTACQTKSLENKFADVKYLSPEDRHRLAVELKLSDRQVKTWFQNRRAKWRRSHNGYISPYQPSDDSQDEKDTGQNWKNSQKYEKLPNSNETEISKSYSDKEKFNV